MFELLLQIPVIGLSPVDLALLLLAAFAGGAFGAAIGALPAFCFTGFAVIAGEAVAIAGVEIEAAGIGVYGAGLTGGVAFGAVFGPHIAFAVGGLFGIIGALGRQLSGGLALPWDPIAIMVVVSAALHRVAFGYPLIGGTDRGLLDMTPFEKGEMRTTASGTNSGDAATDGGMVESKRLAVEPWLPHQYEWANVTMIGLVAGLVGGFLAIETGSAFLGFGISAASLTFLNLGVEIEAAGIGVYGAGLTGGVAFGAVFGPHIAFAGVSGSPDRSVPGVLFRIVNGRRRRTVTPNETIPKH